MVSARIAGARSPRLVVSRGRVLPDGGVGLGRVHPARSVSPEPRLSSSVSAATEPSGHLPCCLHFGSASPPLFVHAPQRRLPASLSLLFCSPCSSAVWASVSELLALLEKAAPPLLLRLRHGPTLSFSCITSLELVTAL